jgi:DNA repair protein RadC
MRPNQKQFIKTVGVYTVRMVRENQMSWDGESFRQPEHVARFVRQYFSDLDREHFLVILLSAVNKPVGVHVVSVGSLNQTLVCPREVFKTAIMGGAAKIIIVHNHPSGNTHPSAEDLTVTHQLRDCGKILDIGLTDSIIIAPDGDYWSAQENNQI